MMRGGGGGVMSNKIDLCKEDDLKKKLCKDEAKENKFLQSELHFGLTNCTRLNGTLAATSVLQF